MRLLSRMDTVAVLAVFGILLVFFFPASRGPFSVTCGPVTAFRALAAARELFAAISAALLMASARQCRYYLQFRMRASFQKSYDSSPLALRC
jgi:hypothetical protein